MWHTKRPGSGYFNGSIEFSPTIAGMMYELDAIAATVIGGTSLMAVKERLLDFDWSFYHGVLRND